MTINIHHGDPDGTPASSQTHILAELLDIGIRTRGCHACVCRCIVKPPAEHVVPAARHRSKLVQGKSANTQESGDERSTLEQQDTAVVRS